MSFESKLEDFGPLRLPHFKGIRIMMMPFLLEDSHSSLPRELGGWRNAVSMALEHSTVRSGVGYLTIDEAVVEAGETHRRPGLHVDGWRGATYGGGGGGYAANGMFQLTNHAASRGWAQTFEGDAEGHDGDCEHLRPQLKGPGIAIAAGRLWWANPLMVHESLPVTRQVARQFMRLSMPSDAPWHLGYSTNPLGILPTGPIHGPREKQMGFRPLRAMAVAL